MLHSNKSKAISNTAALTTTMTFNSAGNSTLQVIPDDEEEDENAEDCIITTMLPRITRDTELQRHSMCIVDSSVYFVSGDFTGLKSSIWNPLLVVRTKTLTRPSALRG